MTRSLTSFFVLMMLSSFLAGQLDSRGNCDLSVRVVASNERSIQGQIQVEVLSPQGVLATVHVAGGESAHFRVVSGKTYSLTISGTGIETITTPYFEIDPLEQQHTETVHVKP